MAPVVQRLVTVAVPAAALTAVAWWSGGYFPRSWGALLLVAAIGLAAVGILAERVEAGRRSAVLIGALLALVAWQLMTSAWAVEPDAPVLEAERTLVYASTALLVLLAVPSRRAGDLVLSVLMGAGSATVGGLVDHALRAGTPGERLDLPVGYTNASGILAATTLVLAVGLTESRSKARRAIGGGLAVPAAVALVLSLSRGSILAAALGLLVIGLASSSLRNVVAGAAVTVLAALAVAVVSVSGGLGDRGASTREVLALLATAGLSLASGAAAAARQPAPQVDRKPLGRRSAARPALLGASAVAAVLLVAVAAYEVRGADSTPTSLDGAPQRLLSTSTSSRGDYWHVAAEMVEAHPLLGAGAGGFTRVWLRERPALLFVRDAHNLYLETFAELGPPGLALLLVALGTPLLAARRLAARPTARAALAAYVVLLAHAALDWDWELPAVSLCTVLLGVALVRLGGEEGPRLLAPWARAALLAGAALLGACAIVVHAGNGATADANEQLDHGNAVAAVRAAERARRFRPLAAEPWELLGEAELAEGRGGAARAHLRRATREDPGSWSAWLSLALATTGGERRAALARARSLNPLAPELQAVSGSENP